MTAGMLLVLLFYACAHVVSPTGGPRDETPPEVVRSTPQNYSPNFDGDEIRIFFDEFVQLQNIRQQLLISPPLETMPEVPPIIFSLGMPSATSPKAMPSQIFSSLSPQVIT